MRRIIAAVVTPLLAAAMLLLGSGTAHAQVAASMDVALTSNVGTLVARGAVVSIPVQFTCTFEPFSYAQVTVSLRQTQGRYVVTGDGGRTLTSADCDGAPN